ncbi:MAG: O-methyltransferase [Bacteroidales bacterium]|nr:O-methyltransferase [Bacteroidales bacterium]MCB9013541.1 O-methyltransferase [Bacteroidales bacterium]
MELDSFNKEIWDYIESYSSPEDPLLEELNRFTHLRVIHPRMLSGKVQGKFLEFISRMIRPERILEIGSYTGYSAICLAKGLQSDGKLITIEISDEIAGIAKKYILKAGMEEKIELICGDALSIIPDLNEEFDLIFIDAEKEQYCRYFELVFPKVKKGGYIIADNTLWDGKVVFEKEFKDSASIALREFNKMIINHPGLENIIIPLRDGLTLIRKLSDLK